MENGLVNLVNRTPENRYRHAIVCLTEATDFKKRINNKTIPVIELKQTNGHDPRIHLRVYRTLRMLGADIIHTRNLSTLEFQLVAALAGVELEGRPWRLEAMATEPLRPVLGPALALLDRTVYMHQTARGEIVGGCEVHGDFAGATLTSDLPVMAHYARHLVEMMPSLASLRILRQWAGIIHASTDFAPLLGPHPDCRDLWISAGWSYGVMGAPAAGALLAEAIAAGRVDARMAPFAVDRKRQGRLIREAAIVVSD